MRVLPIVFNTEMVQAILDGRKTCTRRIVKGFVPRDAILNYTFKDYVLLRGTFKNGCREKDFKFPYQPGDILYVRETWCKLPVNESGNLCGHLTYYYKADGDLRPIGWRENWNPSIYMPKEAARIWLKVTDVRAERLQKITEDGTFDEGLKFTPPCLRQTGENYCDIDGPCTSKIKYCDMTYGELFGRELWNKTIKKFDLDHYGWDANPFVWVIEFERCEKPC